MFQKKQFLILLCWKVFFIFYFLSWHEFACESKGPHLLRPSGVMHNSGQMSDGPAEVSIPASTPIKHVPLVEGGDELEMLHKLKKTLWQQFKGRLLSVPGGVLCLLNISHIGFCVSEIPLGWLREMASQPPALSRHQLLDDQFKWKDCKQGSQSRRNKVW